MRKYYKLINGVWEEINKVLVGQVETEVIDDTLDNGVILYDSHSDAPLPVFTPLKIDNLKPVNIVVTDYVWLDSAGGFYYATESYEWSPQLDHAHVGDIIQFTNQANAEENQYYKVISYSAGLLQLKVYEKLRFFLTAEERVVQYTKIAPYIYRHTMIYVEPTKYLEKIIVNNLCLTNKTDTLKQQIDKALTNCMLLESTETPVFGASSELVEFLGQTTGEEFFFQNSTLREILDSILAVKNARVYIEKITDFNDIKISYVDTNEVKETIEFAKIASTERSNNVETHHGQIAVYGANARLKDILVHGWDYFKTLEPIMTTENVMMIIEFPIETITNFVIKGMNKVRYEISSVTYYPEQVNITDYIYDEEAFKTLPEDRNPNDPLWLPTKKNSIYYTRGSSNVGLGNSQVSFFGMIPMNISNLESAIKAALRKLYDVTAFIDGDIFTLPYMILYYGYAELYGSVTKKGITNNEAIRLSIPDNQSERVISTERYGLNLIGKSSRLGNDEYCIDEVVENHDDLKEVSQKTADNYIIFKRDVSYFNNFAKVRYYLAIGKDINEKIAVNREKRIYNIPLDARECELVIKEYINILPLANQGTANAVISNHKNGSLSSLGLNLLNGYAQASSMSGDINTWLYFSTYNGVTKYGDFALNSARYILGNSIHFVSKLYDNYSVGPSVGGYTIGGRKAVFNPYVDAITGQATSFKVGLRRRQVNISSNLPQATALDYSSDLTSDTTYKYFKDAYQKLAFNLEYEFRSLNVVIGRKLLTHNGLFDVGVRTFDDAVVYASTANYSDDEIYFAKGTIVSGMTITRLDNGTVEISGTLPVNTVSYALCDVDKNLYYAVNDATKKVVLFLPTKNANL